MLYIIINSIIIKYMVNVYYATLHYIIQQVVIVYYTIHYTIYY